MTATDLMNPIKAPIQHNPMMTLPKKRRRKKALGSSAKGEATRTEKAPPKPSKDAPPGAAAPNNTLPNNSPMEVLPAFQEAASEIDLTLGKLISLPAHELVEPISTFVTLEHQCVVQAGRLSGTGRLNRWATGRLLLAVKKSVKHGMFEAWVEEHRPKLGFGKSSAENYMKLARKYETAERFLKGDASLREMYERGNVSEESDTSERPKAGKDTSAGTSKAECLMKCLTTLQKRMRHLTESGEQLETDQVRQFKLVKNEIDRFFNHLINQDSTKL